MTTRAIKSILVASDLTEGSDASLRAAAALAEVAGAELHVLHAFDFDYSPYAERSPVRVTFQGRIADAERAVDEQIKRAAPSANVASREVVIYAAHNAILDRAKDVSADLIVLGAHRGRGMGDALLGGTADRVIRSSRAPCLIIRNELNLPLRRIVVPLDLSNPAREALSLALALPSADDAEVMVIHVLPTFVATDDFPFDESRLGPDLHEDVAEAVHVSGSSTSVSEEIVRADQPADGILEFADDENADLIVLATHGRGALQRALIGSVASGVVRRSTRPILLVPPAVWQGKGGSGEPRP
ncbi:MAG TPA: universal stress protein [Longimicrobiaceae bacterium]|nr:universal stress protein [Longimicrobiaceae bacterium]